LVSVKVYIGTKFELGTCDIYVVIHAAHKSLYNLKPSKIRPLSISKQIVE
jgi:hypothetical protein